MTCPPLALAASTLANACGVGRPAVVAALRAGRSGLAPCDLDFAPALPTCVGRVRALDDAARPERGQDTRSNRLAQLALDQDGFRAAVAAAVARHGAARIGLFVGTTTSGVLSTELAYRAWAQAPADSRGGGPGVDRRAHTMHGTTDHVRQVLGLAGIVQTISTACSSSAKAFAAAARSIAAGLCDAAVVGGVESLALSTLHGFKALELLSARPCRPFDATRDGISIGEGAAFVLLEPAARGDRAAVVLAGCGESSDAWHMSSPHPEGAGAVVAMRAALAAAGLAPEQVGYVNLHGTASVANDAAEDRAVQAVFGAATPVGSTKGQTGHLLGAAGITEALFTAWALEAQWLPGTVHCERVDPALRSNVLREGRAATLDHAISNSFGFGGSNCALVFGRR